MASAQNLRWVFARFRAIERPRLFSAKFLRNSGLFANLADKRGIHRRFCGEQARQ